MGSPRLLLLLGRLLPLLLLAAKDFAPGVDGLRGVRRRPLTARRQEPRPPVAPPPPPATFGSGSSSSRLRGGDGPAALAAASADHQRTGGRSGQNASATAVAAGARRQVPDYRLTLHNHLNVQYYADFTIGGQVIPVIYDTGSFEIIVISEICQSCELTVPVYDKSKSTTFQKGEAVVAQHTFGSGPVISLKSMETVRMGPASSPLTAANMPFWQVIDHHIDVWDRHATFAGIVGLGVNSEAPEMGSEKGEDMSVMLEKMNVGAFGLCLQRDAPGADGFLETGSTVESYKTSLSTFKTVPVVGQIHWGVTLTRVNLGGAHQLPDSICNPSCGAIVDSGTSLLAVPSEVLAALGPFLSTIKEDCSNLDELPALTFDLGGTPFSLPPEAYVMKTSEPTMGDASIWDMIFNPPKVKIADICIPAFMSMDHDSQFGPVWILGMPFLRYYYTVFDRQDRQLHMSAVSSTCAPVPDSVFFAVGSVQGRAASNSSNPWGVRSGALLPLDAGKVRVPSWARPSANKTKFLL